MSLTSEREKEIRKQQEGPDGCFEIGELLAEIDRLRGQSDDRNEWAIHYAQKSGMVQAELEVAHKDLAIAVEALELASYHHQGKHGVGEKFREALSKIRGER